MMNDEQPESYIHHSSFCIHRSALREAAVKKDYGEVMRFLLHFRERYPSEEEYRRFLLEEIRGLVRDLREFDVFISLQPEFLGRPRAMAKAAGSRVDSI
jgi:hypothetical protein